MQQCAQAEAQAAAMAAELIRKEEEVTYSMQGGSTILTHIVCRMQEKASKRKRRRANRRHVRSVPHRKRSTLQG